MATQFGNFKVSFIWVETIPAIAAQQLGDKAQWGFLGMPGQFAKKFGELKAAAVRPSLGFPGRNGGGIISGSIISPGAMPAILRATTHGKAAYRCATRPRSRL